MGGIASKATFFSFRLEKISSYSKNSADQSCSNGSFRPILLKNILTAAGHFLTTHGTNFMPI